MSLGEKLEKYLEEHNIEQKELAKFLGVKEQTISVVIEFPPFNPHFG